MAFVPDVEVRNITKKSDINNLRDSNLALFFCLFPVTPMVYVFAIFFGEESTDQTAGIPPKYDNNVFCLLDNFAGTTNGCGDVIT